MGTVAAEEHFQASSNKSQKLDSLDPLAFFFYVENNTLS